MKAKRQILSLLLALVMVWQGFSFANAEDSNGTAPLASTNMEETMPSPSESTDGTALSTSESTNEAELFSTESEASDESGSIVPVPMAAATVSDCIISAAALSTSSESTGKQIEGAITDIKLLINGDVNKPLQDGGKLYSYQNLQFKAKIRVQGLDITAGDYISIQLPKQLQSKDTSFNISGTGGKTLAKGSYNETTKEIRIIFTKDAENYSGTDGEVYFNTRIDQEKAASMTSDPFKLEINRQTVINYNIEYNIVTRENPKSFFKDRDYKLYPLVDRDGNTHYLIHYTMTLDMRNIKKDSGATSYENVVFTDTLQSNALTYFDVKNHFTDLNLDQADIDKYAPVLRKGIWRSGANNQDGVWENAPDDSDANRGNSWSLRNRQNPNDYAPAVADKSPNYSGGGRSFSYSLGTLDPDDGYELSYYVEINEAFKNGDKFNNSAELTGEGIVSAERSRDFVVSEAGGFLNGQTFNIQIKKVGEDGEALQGAKFTLVKGNYKKTLVTDEYGIAKLENVLKADYILTEVEAPKGYKTDSTPRTISKEAFENSIANGATVEVEVPNKKDNVPPTSPNGGGNGGGGNGGGGNPPKPSPNTPGTPTEPTPGNVLGKNRDPESNPETAASVLGVDSTVPSVLGAGRGIVKTEDASRMPIYLLFFALSACGLTATILYDRKRSKR